MTDRRLNGALLRAVAVCAILGAGAARAQTSPPAPGPNSVAVTALPPLPAGSNAIGSVGMQANGAPVTPSNPMPASSRLGISVGLGGSATTPGSYVVTLAPGVSTQLKVSAATLTASSGAVRKQIQILQIGTNPATACPYATTGTYTCTTAGGYPLEPASALGRQGGSTPIYDGAGVSTDEWDAVSAAGTTLLVMEGN